jgi:spoIIIJ-associated protein
MNYIYEAEGKNKAEAEQKVLDTLGIKSSDVKIKVAGPSKGILGFVSKKPVMVRAYLDSAVLPAETIIRGVLFTVVKKMGMLVEIDTISEADSNIVIELSSDDSKLLIGKQGRTLDALQFILNLMIDNKLRGGKRIMLDIANYRARRQKRLMRLAKAVAERVANTRRPVLLDYMNPYDRRIVHMALEENDRVFTKSDGNGVYKRVRVIPYEQMEKFIDTEEHDEIYEDNDHDNDSSDD